MTIHASGTPLTMTQINAEFALGNSLGVYKGVTWWTDSAQTGAFATSSLKYSDFYSKRKTAPFDAPGSRTFTPADNNTDFPVPRFQHQIVIEVWGPGGSTAQVGNPNIPTTPGVTTVTFGATTITAGPGDCVGGGGRRYVSPAGAGGTASGGDTNTPGNAGSDGQAFVAGGTGGSAPNGGAGGAGGANGITGNNGSPGTTPGGGAGGGMGNDGSSDPSFYGAGGAGSGAYSIKTLTSLAAGSPIHLLIPASTNDAVTGAKGGDSQVKITWS